MMDCPPVSSMSGRATMNWSAASTSCSIHSGLGRRHLHAPAFCVGRRVVVAIVDESFQPEGERAGGPEHLVSDIGRVLALFHPNPLLDQRVGSRIRPYRRRAVQAEALDVLIA